MRKFFWLGTPALAILCVGGYWFICQNVTVVDRGGENAGEVNRVAQTAKDEGDAEPSDVIEPLVVDRGVPNVAPSAPRWTDDGVMPRVTWTHGTNQPPRPDVEPGKVLRMPYADEEKVLGVPLDPIQWILESTLPRLNLFDEPDKTDPPEQAEPKEIAPPVMNPYYHHQHCPGQGGCPAPFPYRAGQRY